MTCGRRRPGTEPPELRRVTPPTGWRGSFADVVQHLEQFSPAPMGEVNAAIELPRIGMENPSRDWTSLDGMHVRIYPAVLAAVEHDLAGVEIQLAVARSSQRTVKSNMFDIFTGVLAAVEGVTTVDAQPPET